MEKARTGKPPERRWPAPANRDGQREPEHERPQRRGEMSRSLVAGPRAGLAITLLTPAPEAHQHVAAPRRSRSNTGGRSRLRRVPRAPSSGKRDRQAMALPKMYRPTLARLPGRRASIIRRSQPRWTNRSDGASAARAALLTGGLPGGGKSGFGESPHRECRSAAAKRGRPATCSAGRVGQTFCRHSPRDNGQDTVSAIL